MPVDWSLYPRTWKHFAASIKTQRAKGRCECTGECGLHQPNPTPRQCIETHRAPARWFRGRVRLSVVHLCTCDPLCLNPDHVKAMCQRCHLRVDRYRHAQARLLTQRAFGAIPAKGRWHPKGSFAPRQPLRGGRGVGGKGAQTQARAKRAPRQLTTSCRTEGEHS